MILIDWFLPGVKGGGPVRSVYSIVELLKDSYEFYIITSSFDLGAEKPYPNITPGELFLRDGVHYYYSKTRRLPGKELKHLLKIIEPDLIYLNSFWSYTFSIQVLLMKKMGIIRPQLLLAPRGMLGSGALTLKARKKKLFISLARLLGLHSGVIFHATQHHEASNIKKLFPDARIMMAPNVNSASRRENISVKKKGEVQAFFLSRISRVKNLHYALDVLRQLPGHLRVEYDIFGNIEDTQYWEECLRLISQMPDHIKVRYKGELPFHQVQETICQYQLLFLPTLNENFGHSIVESLSCGCMILISDQTPWTDIKYGGFALPLSHQKNFMDALQQCAAMNEAEFREQSTQAIEYINKRCDLSVARMQYQTLFYGQS